MTIFTFRFSDENFSNRIVQFLLSDSDNLISITALEIARRENISTSLAHEMLTHLEENFGLICRDLGSKDGIKWYRNLMWNEGLDLFYLASTLNG